MTHVNHDTIAALATPEGEGALAVIRISGPDTFTVLEDIFLPHKIPPSAMEPFRLYGGWLRDGEEKIDEVMAVVMKKPRSYTGEEMAEIYTHGGRAISSLVLDLIISRGARPAQPGEFTRRAFLNGKMDLTRAESVAWLISARSEAELKAAAGQLGGELRERLTAIKGDLIRVLSLVEVPLDFDEYENRPVPYREIAGLITTARDALRSLWGEARAGRCLHEGIRVVIVGKPNVGKSSLLNTFLSRKRAIVSTEPGTTRDTIEEVIRLDGIPLRLIDTAGIHSPSGEIEREGVERAREKAREAELVLIVLDSGTRINADDLKILELVRDKPALLVINKTDLPEKVDLDQIRHELHRKKIIKISLAKNWGFERLRQEIVTLVREEFMGGNTSGVMISQKRRGTLQEAAEALDRTLESAEKKLSGELIAEDLNHALSGVKTILGEECADEVLDEIFSRFCVGK